MFTKAYIISTPNSGDNIFKVRIPYLEDNTGLKSIFSAVLCNQPGEYTQYGVGDCVYVNFDGDTLNYPVIVGKLYTGEQPDSSTTDKMANLYVSTKAVLPKDTKIGDYTVESIIQACADNFKTHISAEDYIIPQP